MYCYLRPRKCKRDTRGFALYHTHTHTLAKANWNTSRQKRHFPLFLTTRFLREKQLCLRLKKQNQDKLIKNRPNDPSPPKKKNCAFAAHYQEIPVGGKPINSHSTELFFLKCRPVINTTTNPSPRFHTYICQYIIVTVGPVYSERWDMRKRDAPMNFEKTIITRVFRKTRGVVRIFREGNQCVDDEKYIWSELKAKYSARCIGILLLFFFLFLLHYRPDCDLSFLLSPTLPLSFWQGLDEEKKSHLLYTHTPFGLNEEKHGIFSILGLMGNDILCFF